MDTGIFNDNRYFDVFIEYAKEDAENILIQISIANRGPETARIDVLPTLWFRNTWCGRRGRRNRASRKGRAKQGEHSGSFSHKDLGERFLYCEGKPTLLFTENETNPMKAFGHPDHTPYAKDGFHDTW